mgnify:CR=1 FL=1
MEQLQTEILLVIILYITLIYEIVDGIRRKNLQLVRENSPRKVGKQTTKETQHRSKNILCRENGEVHQVPYRVNAARESKRHVHFVQMRLIARG